MQCPPTLHHGTVDCSDSMTTKFTDYSDPEVDCCAPRFNPKALTILPETTTTAVTTPDPYTYQQLDGHHYHHHNHHQHDNKNGDHDDNNNNKSNHTMPPTADKPCFYEGRHYQSGAHWEDPVDMCTSCDCKVKCITWKIQNILFTTKYVTELYN